MKALRRWLLLLPLVVANAPGLAAPGGSFNACDAGAAVCDNATPSTYIRTKVAGTAFSLDIVSLKLDGSLDTNYNSTVKVELLDASDNSGALDGDGCRGTWVTIQTLGANPAFRPADNGRITVGPFTVADAYRDVRVRATNVTGASRRGCSSDDFAIRPAAFTGLSVSDSDWTSAGTGRALGDTGFGSVTHKAGQPFSVRAQAVNAAATPALTASYAGTPSAVLSACAGAACSASFGTFSLGGSFGAGQLASDAATYSEVGAFQLQLVDDTFAAVDNGDGSTLAERRIASAPLDVGRFVPDHLAIAAGSTLALEVRQVGASDTQYHDYLVRGFDAVTDGRFPHLLLEHLEGPTLRELIAQMVRDAGSPGSLRDDSCGVMTGWGRDWVPAKVFRRPSWSLARSASGLPVLRSSSLKPAVATWPLVVPDRARIASQACSARARLGRPSAMPPRATPFTCASRSTSCPGFSVTPFTFVPSRSTFGPSAVIICATAP